MQHSLAHRGLALSSRPQAAVVLLPALEEGGGVQASAVAVLELMVVQHKGHTAPALARMPPLPTHPALARVNAELIARQVGRGLRVRPCVCMCVHMRACMFAFVRNL